MGLLASQLASVDASMPFHVTGKVQTISGMTLEASDLSLPLGSLCRILSFGGRRSIAEVIGFRDDRTLLMPLDSLAGVSRGDRIENIAAAPRVACSPQLLGRVIDGLGRPIDGRGPLAMTDSRRIDAKAVAPLARQVIRKPISTGVRAIDGLHTCGLGQRMGLFSGPGVGKSTLMASISKNTSADVSVIALIGERGREVQEFIEHGLGEGGMRRCVVVVSTSDEPPPLRVRAAKVACAVSEYFRDHGLNVLLLMDSLTRLAQAQRQIGLAAREPPATKGFPPSAFAILPEILERAGNTPKGSITGFYTVLVEGDDFNEPIPDAVKGITDGHLLLSRALANKGHYPAIDVLPSISRVRGDVIDAEHSAAARRVLSLWATYKEIEEMVNIGAYGGGRPEFDLAIEARDRIIKFLQQGSGAACDLATARREVVDLAGWIELREKQLKAAPTKAAARPAMR